MTRMTALNLLEKYGSRGVDIGGELLLSKADALEFVADAQANGIPLTGITGWYRPPQDETAWAEDVAGGCSVPNEILAAPYAVDASAAIVRDFLVHWIHVRVERVTVGTIDPQDRAVDMTRPTVPDDHKAMRREIAILELEVAKRHRLTSPIDIDRLILAWDDFADEVTVGYDDTIEVYCRSLVWRDHVEEVLNAASEDVREFLAAQIVAADHTFEAATMVGRKGWDLSRYYAIGDASWWSRGPFRLGKLAGYFPDALPMLREEILDG